MPKRQLKRLISTTQIILTYDGAALCTVSIIGAYFHPAVKIHLQREIAHNYDCIFKHACNSEIFSFDSLTSSMLGWPVLGSKKAKVFTSNLLN